MFRRLCCIFSFFLLVSAARRAPTMRLVGVVDAVGDFFKSVVACACCLLIGGPALIIAGSILFSQKDLRKAFSDAVKEFNPTPLNAWSGTINDVPITTRRELLNVKGVDGATSVFAEAVVPVSDKSSAEFPVSVNVSTVFFFLRKAPFISVKKLFYRCFSSECKYGKDDKCKRDCRNFEAKCIGMGGVYVFTPTSCNVGDVCAECRLIFYLRQLYIVVRAISNGKYVADTKLRSARYAFGDLDNDYQPGLPSTVTVRLYSSKDPYIALQRLTKGTNDLGMNLRIVGIVLIVLGCLFLLLEIGVCTALICYWTRPNKKSLGTPLYLAPASSGISTSGGPGDAAPNPYAHLVEQTGQGYAYGQPLPPGYTYGQPLPPGYTYGQPLPPGYTYGQPLPPGYEYDQEAPPAEQQDREYGGSLYTQEACGSFSPPNADNK
ncbi:trans-sialidase, putative [Trypanosoma cruzi marinkellei]|uniref:Trans-sialidase, putative n=1 Tax=Trypanosoma cruzi marinkellei TaxID=85056 RepID=K2NVQ2_TRYCR|nr:trans-sialidase, putative [Trypanosoma cruzi marinkellei]